MLKDGSTPLLFLTCGDDTPDPFSAGLALELFSLLQDWAVLSCLRILASRLCDQQSGGCLLNGHFPSEGKGS